MNHKSIQSLTVAKSRFYELTGVEYSERYGKTVYSIYTRWNKFFICTENEAQMKSYEEVATC